MLSNTIFSSLSKYFFSSSTNLPYLVTADRYGSHPFTQQLRDFGRVKKVDDPISPYSQTKET